MEAMANEVIGCFKEGKYGSQQPGSANETMRVYGAPEEPEKGGLCMPPQHGPYTLLIWRPIYYQMKDALVFKQFWTG